MDLERMLYLSGIKKDKEVDTKTLTEALAGDVEQDIKSGDQIYSKKHKKVIMNVFGINEGIINGFTPNNKSDVKYISMDKLEKMPYYEKNGKMVWTLVEL